MKKQSTFWKDFKAFISRGNIVDLAVAVVVGAAFTAIVNSLVNDIIKPLITLLVGGNSMSDLVVILRPATEDAAAITLNYGNLIMAILTFLIDAFVIFIALRILARTRARIREEGERIKGLFERKPAAEEGEGESAPAQASAKSEAEAKAEAAPKAGTEPKAESAEPVCAENAQGQESVENLLREIRDLLAKQRQ